MSKTNTLEKLCNTMIEISMATQGRTTDWRGLQTSLVFAKLCATCISFLRLIPSSTFYTPAKTLQLWDLSSAAALCRCLIESYYVLVYLRVRPADKVDAEFQRLLWEFHEAYERHKMTLRVLPDSPKLPQLQARVNDCRTSLESSACFQRLSERHQQKILKGKQFKLASGIELSRVAGVSQNYYAGRYKYCSAFAHTAPFSISQLDAFRAGTPASEDILNALVGTATGYTALAVRDFTGLFPDQAATLSADDRQLINVWEETFRWEKSEWFNVQ